MREKEIFVTKPYLPPKEEFQAYLDRIWESGWLTNIGACHDELTEKLKEYLHVQGLELFCNGHLALEMAIQALLGDKKGGEIITTPFSFASTTHAIVRNGFTPVFADIKTSDCTIDPEKIEEKITDRTVGIIPVHVYGNICDVDAIGRLAEKYGLKVIYDAAHAFGETLDGCPVVKFGDISMISFHATKVFHTVEGGALCYEGGDFDSVLRKLRNFGITGPETVEYVGGNAKMNELQAAMGICVLKHMDEVIAKRKELYDLYTELLSEKKSVKLLDRNPRVSGNYGYMPVLCDDRDGMFEKLSGEGIHARKYFYPCINDYDCYRKEYDVKDTPVAQSIAEQIMTLPLYPQLDRQEVVNICGLFD